MCNLYYNKCLSFMSKRCCTQPSVYSKEKYTLFLINIFCLNQIDSIHKLSDIWQFVKCCDKSLTSKGSRYFVERKKILQDSETYWFIFTIYFRFCIKVCALRTFILLNTLFIVKLTRYSFTFNHKKLFSSTTV